MCLSHVVRVPFPLSLWQEFIVLLSRVKDQVDSLARRSIAMQTRLAPCSVRFVVHLITPPPLYGLCEWTIHSAFPSGENKSAHSASTRLFKLLNCQFQRSAEKIFRPTIIQKLFKSYPRIIQM